MLSARRHKREILIMGIGVAVIALMTRYAWLPANPELALAHAAEKWDLSVTEAGRWFSAWSLGDGQAFAVIAADPLGLDQGLELGAPYYRYSRPGFGWLAWMLSLGREQWVPYSMALVGAMAIVGTFILAARLRPNLWPPAWLMILNPAVFLAFAGDTAESLAVLALAWAMATGSWLVAATIGVIRPTFAVALLRSRKMLLAAVGTTVGLQAIWITRFGFELRAVKGHLDWPLAGYLDQPSLLSLALALFAVVTVVLGWLHRNWAWLASGIFVLCLSAWVVALPENAWRVTGFLFVLWAFGPDYSPPASTRVLGVLPSRASAS